MNKIILLTFGLLIGSLTPLLAQTNLPPAYELKTDTGTYVRLDSSYYQILEDSTQQWTIEQVAGPAFSRYFGPDYTATLGLQPGVTSCWYRFRIVNRMDHAVQLFMGNQLDFFDLYTQDRTGRWHRQQTGRRVPFNQRDGLKASMTLPVTIPAGKEVLVYQLWHDVHMGFSFLYPNATRPTFAFKEHLHQAIYVDRLEKNYESTVLLHALFWGALLVMAVYHLCILLVVRERVYLYYTLMLLFFCFSRLPASIRPFLFTDSYFAIMYGQVAAYVLTDICLAQFIRYFLQTPTKLPKQDKWLVRVTVIWSIIHPLFYLQAFSPYPSSPTVAILLFVVFFAAIIAVALFFLVTLRVLIHCARTGFRGAQLLLAGVIPMFALMTWWRFLDGLLQVPRAFSSPYEKLTNELFFTNEVTQGLAAVWLILIFSGALSLRYNDMRKEIAQQALEKEQMARKQEIERNQLIEAQKVELEHQVAERTAEVLTQKREIEVQRDNLEQTLVELQTTQEQLIQKEKMASLGELTAGIAHEIQNPLNFVNNFSMLSVGLLDEFKEEYADSIAHEAKAEAIELLGNLAQNLDKISHHGKRADGIVKGMLQHSRTSTGTKQPTDLNALAEEYLRLSYHGFRAKDKSFQADLQLQLGTDLGKVLVVPQDMGRVMLNIYNNAFYAMQEKARQTTSGEYLPQLILSTHRHGEAVEIRIRDNGTGIPKEIVSKIYQPFFTTKPTGHGNTGLGLSLSYDIVTKLHGGTIRVESQLGDYTEFIVQLPVCDVPATAPPAPNPLASGAQST